MQNILKFIIPPMHTTMHNENQTQNRLFLLVDVFIVICISFPATSNIHLGTIDFKSSYSYMTWHTILPICWLFNSILYVQFNLFFGSELLKICSICHLWCKNKSLRAKVLKILIYVYSFFSPNPFILLPRNLIYIPP